MIPSQNETLQRLQAHNAKNAFNSWLGIEVLAASATDVELRVPWRSEFRGAPGVTHGGILASLVDTASNLVLLAARGTCGPAVDLQIDYHRNTVSGALYVNGTLLRAGASISTIEVRITDRDRRLVASGRCVYLTRSRVTGYIAPAAQLDIQHAAR